LLNAAKRAGVKRFVHVSTEAVLVDDKPIIAADETRPRPERPIGLYPTTKGKAEALVQEMNSVEFQTVICRPRFIWGAGDTSVLPQFVEAVKSGRYMWFDGGRYLTSTCHVKNVCEGLILAAEKGRAGEIYFLTDGEPIEFRTFLTELLKTQGVTIADRSLPGWLAHVLATVSETVWTTFNLKGNPLLTRTTYYLMGREVTVKDAKARRELGYEGKVSRQQGLAEMASGQ
jgi:nucleoside-diphosphate-sugar epimerase